MTTGLFLSKTYKLNLIMVKLRKKTKIFTHIVHNNGLYSSVLLDYKSHGEEKQRRVEKALQVKGYYRGIVTNCNA